MNYAIVGKKGSVKKILSNALMVRKGERQVGASSQSLKSVVSNALFFMMLLNCIVSAPLFAEEKDIPSEEKVSLTEDEQDWLKAHPDIELGYTDAFEPEVIVNPDGSLRGIQVDILAELNRRLGTRIRLRIYPVPEVVEKAQKREVDGILSLHPEYVDKLGLLKTRSYFTGYPAVFARKDVAFNYPSDLAGKRVAIIDKVFFSEQIVAQHGKGATVLKVQNAEEGLHLVNNGQADYFLGASLNAYLITKYQLFDLATQYVFYDYRIDAVIGTRSDWLGLISILNKGLSTFTKEEIEAIVAKWVQLPQQKKVVELTPEERDWLAQNHKVRVRVGEYPPNYFIKDGKPFGIAIDILNEVSQRTGIKFGFVYKSRSFPEDLKGLIQHADPDILPSLQKSPEREKKILFTKPYVTSPRFIFTRDDTPFVGSMEDLSGKTVAVEKSFLVHEWLTKDYPDITVLTYANTIEALSAVSSGSAFAYIGPLRATSNIINMLGYQNIKATTPSSLPDGITGMGIRNDWPELQTIINKVFDSIPEEEKASIVNRWSTVKFDYGIRHVDIVKWILVVAGVASGIVILFVLWNRNLAKKVKERTAELTSSEFRYRSVVEDSPGLICRFEPAGTITFVNDAYCIYFGKNWKDLIGTSFFSPIPEEDRERVAADIAALTLEAPVQAHEHRVIGPDGQIWWHQWTYRAMFNEDGRVTAYQSFGNDITERKHAEEKVQQYQKRLKALASQLTVAEEGERRRIAVDLHDHVGQSLSLARMQIAAARRSAVDAGLTDKLDEISEILREAVHDTRHLMFDLSSPAMHEIGLSAAVSEWLEEQIEERYGIKTEFFYNIDEAHKKVLDENVRAILFRNVRELLTNVVKHAYANQVSASMEHTDGSLKIVVQDDGIGFDYSSEFQRVKSEGGFGLFSIQERMADMGGTFEIISEPGKGCKAILKVPLGEKE